MMRLILLMCLIPVQGFHQWKMHSVRPTLVALPQSSVSSFQNNNTTSALPVMTPSLIQRSSTVALSCMVTWATIKLTGWSIVRASSTVGVASALTMSPAFAAASFCGSFAGMSGHVSTLSQTAVLGLACGLVFYLWDVNKMQIGKGGRLGTIAFLGNMLFDFIRNGGPGSVLMAIMNTLSPVTAATVAASGAVSIASGRKTEKGTHMNSLLHQVSKAVLLGSLFHRLITNGVSLTKWSISAACIFLASLVVKNTTPWKGIVMAASIVGLLGSFTPWAAAIYLGAFIGMTGRESFYKRNLLQASLFSAVLLELGLFNGFGGRLGFLAFLGVNFGL